MQTAGRKSGLVLGMVLGCAVFSMKAEASHVPEFSTAGFFPLDGTGREALSMNPAWRFYKGPLPGAEAQDFDDGEWDVVSLPHSVDLLPAEASGGVNYQGEVWYRKHFVPSDGWQGRKVFLHFEGIMGKSRVYVNGRLLTEHYGGFLPVIADLTPHLEWGEDNVVAVCADNSDDSSYPPGKAQDVLDYAYFGGIYRDCWLVVHDLVHVTDPNYEDVVAGGGLFVSFGEVSAERAEVDVRVHVRNEGAQRFNGKAELVLEQDGHRVAEWSGALRMAAAGTSTVGGRLLVDSPALWSPEHPQLYDLYVRLRDGSGRVVDGYRRRVGIRSVEFKGSDGFWLNGKPYEGALVGANRHQDFAVVGNALSNNVHWRDAKKLRDAGLKVIRNAHYPQDPAFMDACDELGLFVIVNTPGWQFWNSAPEFGERVFADIRNMVRRDRNHACVWLWEPVLNETHYPVDFARKAREAVDEEYPFRYCYSACDAAARGSEWFPVHFAHPANGDAGRSSGTVDDSRVYFTREWGDNVDDWNSHNSPSRVARAWGEVPMLVQARHYASPGYACTSYDVLCRAPRQHVGGCLWHSFDHQRGYHPDPFYGGIMDAFRQPKYSYYMFQSQRPAVKEDRLFDTGPMVYIAHEMTPFSPSDVTVYSNCEEVRLTFCAGGEIRTYVRPAACGGMPSPVIVFEDVYDFMTDKAFSGRKKQQQVYLLAEGLVDGQVVATHKVSPARRPSRLLLWVDDEGVPLRADGSDWVTVVAAMADAEGNVKRLSNEFVKFHVEGEGRLLGGADVLANPAPLRWGTAPVLVQSTLKPGRIKVTASVLFEGSQKAVGAELWIESRPAARALVYDEGEAACLPAGDGDAVLPTGFVPAGDAGDGQDRLRERAARLEAVERQQAEFGEP